jgi:hypothetical protein
MGFDATPTPRKERYFAFRGLRREQRESRAAIAHLIQPYPKRPRTDSRFLRRRRRGLRDVRQIFRL